MINFIGFMIKTEQSSILDEFLIPLDESENIIHLHMLDKQTSIRLDDVLYTFDNVSVSTMPNVFFTNFPELFYATYRFYHQTFDGFVYLNEAADLPSPLIQTFDFMRLPLDFHMEMINKPIYTNLIDDKICNEYQASSYRDWKHIHEIQKNDEKKIFQKYYYENNNFYLYEPIFVHDKIIIDLKKQQPPQQTYENTVYLYDYNQNLDKLYLSLKIRQTKEDLENVFHIFDELMAESKSYTKLQSDILNVILQDMLVNLQVDIEATILLLSFLIHLTKNKHYYQQLYSLTSDSVILSPQNKCFLHNQLKRISFENRGIANGISLTSKSIYPQIVDYYHSQLKDYLNVIPFCERNKKTVIVFVKQLLSERNAPTKTTLERCYTLGNLMGYNILLINTKEQYTSVGALFFYRSIKGNVVAEYDGDSKITYKDFTFPFGNV